MANASMLLDTAAWDLVLDASGNIAVATEPYSLAQDAASAIQTYLGEYYWDTTIGVPWLTQILGQAPSLALLKAQLAATAETVPDVASAKVFIGSFLDRNISGQVQVVSAVSGQPSRSNFVVKAPSAPTPPSSGLSTDLTQPGNEVVVPIILTGI